MLMIRDEHISNDERIKSERESVDESKGGWTKDGGQKSKEQK